MRYMYALNRKGLKARSVYALNKGNALNNGVRLTTRVYGINYGTKLHVCGTGTNTDTLYVYMNSIQSKAVAVWPLEGTCIQ